MSIVFSYFLCIPKYCMCSVVFVYDVKFKAGGVWTHKKLSIFRYKLLTGTCSFCITLMLVSLVYTNLF